MQADGWTEGGTDTFPLFVQCTKFVKERRNSQKDCNGVNQIQYTRLFILKQL